MNKFIVTLLSLLTFSATSAVAEIQAGRAIQISIGGVSPQEEARINKVYPVSEAGSISMPFIGSVRVAGLSSERLAAVLKSRYTAAEIYTDAVLFHVIDSNEKSVEQKVIYIGGDVGRTGPIPYTRGMTLYQAIQTAGGETEFGAINRILLFRDGQTFKYDLRKHEDMNVILKPNDTIDVPRKNWIGQ